MDRVVVDFSAVQEAATEAVWQDLPFGVKLKMRPLLGLLAASIEGEVSADLSALAQGEDVIGQYGYASEDVGLLADRSVAQGWARMHIACVRGAALIEDWNLSAEDGQPIEISKANIQKLFQFGVAPGAGAALLAAFNRICDAPAVKVSLEKKGSPASLTGDLGEAGTTARAAASPATPAPPVDA